MSHLLLKRGPRTAALAVAFFGLTAFSGKTCDWIDSSGCHVAVTQYSGGYTGMRDCGGTSTTIWGSGQYNFPQGADCIEPT